MKFLSPIDVNGYISLTTQNPGATPTKFLIQDANGKIAFRTGQELKVDIGADYTEVVRHTVKASVAINKGQAVYTIPTQNGTNILVGLASNNAESTSSKTLGLLDATVAINGVANVVTQGLLAGLNTATATIGDPVWLGTNGNLIYGLANKPYAPAHLVFIGIVTRVNLNNGEIFVRTQNGFELDELHDVDLKTTTPINGHILGYDGTLWVNKTIAGWLGFTPQAALNGTGFVKVSGSTVSYDNTTYYPASNPSAYISGINNAMVVAALGYTPYSNTNPNNYISGITSSMVTTALGYTPISSLTDTLATVTSRGAMTTSDIFTPNNGGIFFNGNAVYGSGVFGKNAGQDLAFNAGGVVRGRFLSTGFFGIGTETPLHKVHIEDSGAGSLLRLNNTAASWSSTMLYGTTTATAGGFDFIGMYANGSAKFNVGSTGTASASSDFRAPIFYDANDTTYYGDFNATTRQYQAISFGDSTRYSAINTTINGSGAGDKLILYGNTSNYDARLLVGADYDMLFKSQGNSSGRGSYKFYSGNTCALALTIDGTQGLRAGTSYNTSPASTYFSHTLSGVGTNRVVNFDGNGTTPSVWWTNGSRAYGAIDAQDPGMTFWANNGSSWQQQMAVNYGNITINTDIRTPILYDSNDTAYYVNPASTSNLNAATFNGNVSYFGQLGIENQSTFARLAFNKLTFWDWQGSEDVVTIDGGYLQAANSLRAPIFYDNNNTGYYVDPASTSSVNIMSTSETYLGNSSAYSFGTSKWAGTGGYPGYSYTGGNHRFGFSSTGGYIDVYTDGYFYCGIDPTGGNRRVLNEDEWIGNKHFGSGGAIYGTIFYDTNNSGYYLDPNSTSNLYAADFAGPSHFTSNSGGYSGSLSNPPLQAYSNSNNSAFFSFHKGGNYALNMGLDADNVLRIGGWSASSNRFQMDMSGNLTMAGDITAYSDARVKENVVTVDKALEKVNALRGVYYNRTDSEDKRTKLGVIAQEILEVVPEVVSQDNDGMYNVSYGNLAGLFIEAIKEQQTQIEELKQLVNQLINK